MRAVSNAGPIIHLSWIDHISILPKLFDMVLVPDAVRDELLRGAPEVLGLSAVVEAFKAGWLTVEAVHDADAATRLREELDRGEAEAITLMEETRADLLLLDDRRARANALGRNLPIIGTVGLLSKARERGLILAASPLIERLQRHGFRISSELVDLVRHEDEAQ